MSKLIFYVATALQPIHQVRDCNNQCEASQACLSAVFGGPITENAQASVSDMLRNHLKIQAAVLEPRRISALTTSL